ncbi:CMRF35-like molecule 8 [Dicentrarchus labrax]|uniref:CMRF35-like molecule 8 n=1 Tax=Dicentrarchus labrax TaxID=13489 RepID=UPI0021F5CDC3|nr:CMRF35-like molecule 8 [Dicentrarchus labrax]
MKDREKFKVEVEKDGCKEQFNQTAYRTAKTTITCDYPENKQRSSVKFLCRENNFTCEEILSTNFSVKSNGTFTLTETNSGFSVSISNVSSHDAGLYWCGVKEGNYRTGLRKIQLKVEVKTPTSTSASAERDGGSQVVITLVVCVAVLLLLLFVIILILIYKRCSHSKHRRNGAAEHTREDYVYEEVQVYVQKPDSGNAVTTIYATANFPTNPSASLHYSTINFSSDKAGGEAVILKPSSSACEYSIVQNSQSPTYSTVSEPSRSPEDPLYSTVNKPK